MCLQLLPGEPVSLRFDSKAAAGRLAATNGADAKERLILAGATLQLQDEHGNAVAAPGFKIRLNLQWADSRQGKPASVPRIHSSAQELPTTSAVCLALPGSTWTSSICRVAF
jgi:hypothetical protein